MAKGNENMSDAFQIIKESQVSFTATATCQSAKAGFWDVTVENTGTGQVWRACGVEVEATTPQTMNLGFSLRLQPGNYKWTGIFRSDITGGIVKPKQEGTHTVVDESNGSVPAGWIGNFTVYGTRRPYFLFSGGPQSMASVKASLECQVIGNNAVSGIVTVENLTAGSSLLSPEIYSTVDPRAPMWTELTNLHIKYGHLYRVSIGAVTSGSEITTTRIGLSS